MALIVLGSTSVAVAYNFPALRSALERWKSDARELVVFLEEPLSLNDDGMIKTIEHESMLKSGVANLNVLRVGMNQTADQ